MILGHRAVRGVDVAEVEQWRDTVGVWTSDNSEVLRRACSAKLVNSYFYLLVRRKDVRFDRLPSRTRSSDRWSKSQCQGVRHFVS